MTPELWAYTRRLGPAYGTEDLAVWLYATLKMRRHRTVVELGTGLGVCALWMAAALRENGAGEVISIDDGRDWESLRGIVRAAASELPGAPGRMLAALPQDATFDAFRQAMAAAFGLEGALRFPARTIDVADPLAAVDGTIDLLLVDFAHMPADALQVMAAAVPRLSDGGSILFDSASTLWPTYVALEATCEELNRGKLPPRLLAGLAPDARAAWRDLAATRRFRLMHLVEAKERVQNGTAWLVVEPLDLLPYPPVSLRGSPLRYGPPGG